MSDYGHDLLFGTELATAVRDALRRERRSVS